MNTPITDKLNMKFHEDESASFVDSYVGMRNIARRLELDRAALMEALESVSKDFTTFRQIANENGVYGTWGALSLRQSELILATARANFPNED